MTNPVIGQLSEDMGASSADVNVALNDAVELILAGDLANLAAKHGPDVQLVLDPNGIVRFSGGYIGHFNGLTHDELVNNPIWELIHPEDLESALGAMNEASRSEGYHMPTRIRVVTGGGTWVHVELTGTTFELTDGAWLVVSVRPTESRGQVVERRRRLDALLRQASMRCSASTWVEADEIVEDVLSQLAGIVGAQCVQIGWEVDGVMSFGGAWPASAVPTSRPEFPLVWPLEILTGSLLQFTNKLDDLPPSLLRDRMIVDGVRAVVELPLSNEAPWGVARVTFRNQAATWDDANADVVKDLARTLMSMVRRCRAERVLQIQATTDGLTGLMNRSQLYHTLDQFLEDRRNGGRLAVFFGDLDNFKMLNDLRGHEAGDQVLRSVADALRASVRAVDVIARIGGDEFVIVCPDVDDLDILHRIRERILEEVSRIDTLGVPVSMSLGMALAEADETGKEIMGRADSLMYRSKRASASRRLEAEQKVPANLI